MVSLTEAMDRCSSLTNEEATAGWEHADSQFPIRITRSWFNRIQSPEDPLGKQVFPQPTEMKVSNSIGDLGLMDPVGEQGKMPVPFVVQKHDNRLLLLVSRKCHLHCRYCFRRTLDDLVEPTPAELTHAIDYVLQSGVEEVILSGGDPLFLPDQKLGDIIERLNAIPTLRIHTRAPITFPSRVRPSLMNALKRHSNVWMIVHCNHKQELGSDVRRALQEIRQANIPLLNQSVLLKGINDDAHTLADLSKELVRIGVFPYYLHHTDEVVGAEDFYVTMDEGDRIVRQLETLVSGVSLPKYVIDRPDGSGKIPVERLIHQQNRSRS